MCYIVGNLILVEIKPPSFSLSPCLYSLNHCEQFAEYLRHRTQCILLKELIWDNVLKYLHTTFVLLGLKQSKKKVINEVENKMRG